MTKSEIIATEYPELQNIAFFDYTTFAPTSVEQINQTKTTSMQIQPSPHSSEEQSLFDRSQSELREKIALLFGTSQISFAVVIFPSREVAFDVIIEGFPWRKDTSIIIDDDFAIKCEKSLRHIEKQKELNAEKQSTKRTLYCFSYSERSAQKAKELRRSGSGSYFLLCDVSVGSAFEIPNLDTTSYDYTLLSFRHLCGCSLTACVMRLESAGMIVPSFYGGGAVSFSCARTGDHSNFKSHSRRLENGTPAMLPVFSALSGLNILKKLQNTPDFRESAKAMMDKLKEIAKSRFQIREIGNYVIEMTCEGVDYQELKDKFAEQSVILGMSEKGLLLSIGIASKDEDVIRFESALNSVF